LNEHVEPTKFTENQLKKIGLGRVFCSDANIFVLDNPFIGFSSESIAVIE
jgi:ABC-type multidrug transport system ATPase subunit